MCLVSPWFVPNEPNYSRDSKLKLVMCDKYLEMRNLESTRDTHCPQATLLTLVTSRTPDQVFEHTPAGGQTTSTAGTDTRRRTRCNFLRNHLWPWGVMRGESLQRERTSSCRVSPERKRLSLLVCVTILVFLSHNLWSNLIYFWVRYNVLPPPPPSSVAATHRHGNYGPKLAQYFMEWHFYFSLPSISAPSTHFSAHAFGGLSNYCLTFSPLLYLCDASPSPLSLSVCVVLSFVISFIKIARQKSLLIIYNLHRNHY